MRGHSVVRLKICMLDPLFFPYFGGTEKVVLEVGSRLVKNHGYEVQVLTSMIPQAKGVRRENLHGLDVIRTPSFYMERMPSFIPPPFTISPLLGRDMRSKCSDAHVFHVHNRFWYSPLTYLGIKRWQGKKLMLTIHNARPRGISKRVDYWGGLYDELIGRSIFAACDRINCVSEATLRDTIPEQDRRKATVVYNGVDTKRFRPGLDVSDLRKKLGVGSSTVVLSNGRLVEQKGFPILIDAMAKVRERFKDTHLVIIGKGPMKDELTKKASALGMADSLHFVTGIPEEQIPLYYGMADVFALASFYEPSAVVLYEALGCGKAIVATNAGGNPEIVSPECGFIVPTRDPQALSERIGTLLSDESLRKKCEIASRERAERLFDWDVVAKAWHDSYKAIA